MGINLAPASRKLHSIGQLLKRNRHGISHYAGLGLMGLGFADAINVSTSQKLKDDVYYYDLLIEGESDAGKIRCYKLQKYGSIGKMYARPVVMFGGGMALNQYGYTGTNNERKRLGEYLVATTAAFAGYRGEVVKKYGEEVDQELMYGGHDVEVENTITEGEETKTSVVAYTEYDPEKNRDIYSFEFGPGNENWKGNSFEDMQFINQVIRWAKHRLEFHGELYLNEFRQALGCKPIKDGYLKGVGWFMGNDGKPSDEYMDIQFLYKPDGSIIIRPNVTTDLYNRLNLPTI